MRGVGLASRSPRSAGTVRLCAVGVVSGRSDAQDPGPDAF
jgi:hypothetical protein